MALHDEWMGMSRTAPASHCQGVGADDAAETVSVTVTTSLLLLRPASTTAEEPSANKAVKELAMEERIVKVLYG